MLFVRLNFDLDERVHDLLLRMKNVFASGLTKRAFPPLLRIALSPAWKDTT